MSTNNSDIENKSESGLVTTDVQYFINPPEETNRKIELSRNHKKNQKQQEKKLWTRWQKPDEPQPRSQKCPVSLDEPVTTAESCFIHLCVFSNVTIEIRQKPFFPPTNKPHQSSGDQFCLACFEKHLKPNYELSLIIFLHSSRSWRFPNKWKILWVSRLLHPCKIIPSHTTWYSETQTRRHKVRLGWA